MFSFASASSSSLADDNGQSFQTDHAPSDAGETRSFARRLTGRLRGAVVKLCFAGLLATAATLQLFTLVSTVANGTQQIALATRGAEVFTTIARQGDGVVSLISDQAPRDALLALEQRQQVLALTGDSLQDFAYRLPAGAQLELLQQEATILLSAAKTVVLAGGQAADLAALRTQVLAFGDLQVAMQEAQLGLAQEHLVGLEQRTRAKITLMVAFLAATVFLLSTVLVTGFREMARRQEIEDELKEAMAEVDQASKAKSRFLSTVTHEIRTPLNAILGFSELLGREPLSPDQKQQVSRLNNAGRTLSRIVDDVLDLSRIEEGGLELRDEDFSPNELFREAVDLVSVHSQAKGLILSSEISSNMPRSLQGDPLRLSQVLLNLLNNAIKFTHEGSVTLKADARVIGETARLRIEVQDSGIGIAEGDQARLFDRYVQTDDGFQAQSGGGSGLGLAIAQGLVHEMGSQLEMHSTPQQGTTFWFYVDLPVIDARSELPIEVPELSVLNAAAERLMLVDDSVETGELIQRIMGREGIHVEVVTNPLDALAQVMQYDPDVIMCDMQMPELSGVELTRQIRKLPKPFCDVPVVAFSATSMTSEIEQMIQAGANAFVAKPFQINDLVGAISAVLEEAGERHAKRAAARKTTRTFAEVEQMVDLMGKDWAQRFLGRLRDRLEDGLNSQQSRTERMAMAHRVVAEAGQIGERDLSLAATALEEALRAGGDISREEARFRNEARAFLSRLPLLNFRIG